MSESLYEYTTKKLFSAKQLHVLQHSCADEYLDYLNTFDFLQINNLFEQALKHSESNDIFDRVEPLQNFSLWNNQEETPEIIQKKYESNGLTYIANGQLAVITIARDMTCPNGSLFPMGMYRPNLISGKSLFQLQAERILRLEEMSKALKQLVNNIPWYIMTNRFTSAITIHFFEENEYFGLKRENVNFFEQEIYPVCNFSGKIILTGIDKIALRATSTGGIYSALGNSLVLLDMGQRNISHVFICNVDDILVKVGDPIFLGYCIQMNADVGIKITQKNAASDPHDIICQLEDHVVIIDSREFPMEKKGLLNNKKELIFSTIYTNVQVVTKTFLELVVGNYVNNVPYHLMKTKVPFLNDNRVKEYPDSENGYYLKKMIYDGYCYADKIVLWEVPQFTDFSQIHLEADYFIFSSPVATSHIFRLHKIYVEKAGGRVRLCNVEISPLLSYAGEDLEDTVRGQTYTEDTYLTISTDLRKNELQKDNSQVYMLQMVQNKTLEFKEAVRNKKSFMMPQIYRTVNPVNLIVMTDSTSNEILQNKAASTVYEKPIISDNEISTKKTKSKKINTSVEKSANKSSKEQNPKLITGISGSVNENFNQDLPSLSKSKVKEQIDDQQIRKKDIQEDIFNTNQSNIDKKGMKKVSQNKKQFAIDEGEDKSTLRENSISKSIAKSKNTRDEGSIKQVSDTSHTKKSKLQPKKADVIKFEEPRKKYKDPVTIKLSKESNNAITNKEKNSDTKVQKAQGISGSSNQNLKQTKQGQSSTTSQSTIGKREKKGTIKSAPSKSETNSQKP